MLIGFQEPGPDVLDSLVVQEPLCPLTWSTVTQVLQKTLASFHIPESGWTIYKWKYMNLH